LKSVETDLAFFTFNRVKKKWEYKTYNIQ